MNTPHLAEPRSAALRGAAHALADGWKLAAPFWRARDQRRAWLLLAAVVGLTLATVWLNVRFNRWNNAFYDTLQNHDMAGFWHQLGVFGVLAALFIVAAVYRQYLQQVLFIRWRTWLTERLSRGWLQPGTAYRVGAAGAPVPVDNPDQRIAEDARGFVSSTLDLGLGVLNASVTLVSFVGILWGLSGALVLHGHSVPGYMVWVAVVYSLLGSGLAHRLGRPLIGLSGEQQKVEADFRYALVQVRDHAEAIALARGERREGARLRERFDAIRANWTALILTTKRLTWFSAGYGQVAIVFPILAAAPRYFSGAIQLGGLMQTAQAFGQVQGALSWFIGAYPQLADWRATVNRLTRFDAACDDDLHAAHAPAIERGAPAGAVLRLDSLVLATPDGATIARLPPARFESGGRVLIQGPSGAGKSSLLRALAGVARNGSGRIVLPAGTELMFVPQRPYLPEGTLREALAYPADPAAFDTPALAQALQRTGLAHYAGQLDEAARWAQRLSPGEQQRVHFARVLLQQPGWVFLDESTSALDEAAERELYAALHAHCPATTVVSVGHRASLRPLHDQQWSIHDGTPSRHAVNDEPVAFQLWPGVAAVAQRCAR